MFSIPKNYFLLFCSHCLSKGFISVLSCLFLFVFGTYLCDKKIKERRNGPLSVQFDD